MIILNRKKISLVILITFILVFGFAFISDKNENVPTVSLPVSGKTIVIDAGHGKPDEGDKMLKLKNKTLQMAIYQRKTLVG